jgi:hypothetical protein
LYRRAHIRKMPGMNDARGRDWTWLIALLLLAAGLRIWNFPPRYFERPDENGYLYGSLALLEGLPPGFKAAPAGPQTWLGWTYAATKSALNLITPTSDERGMPLQVRPFVAIDRALFDLYRDSSALRRFIVTVNVILSLAAVYCAFQFGHFHAGGAGAVVAGALVATSPLFIDYAAMSRPYAMAWCFAVMATRAASQRRVWLSGILLGLAIGSRIDMLVAAPLVLWQIWSGARNTLKLIAITATTTLLVAPWLATGLIGTLRAIATIQFSTPPHGNPPPLLLLWEFIGFTAPHGPVEWGQALVVPALILLIGLAWLCREAPLRHGVLFAYLLFLLLTLFKSTGYGIHHKGGVVVAVICAAAIAIAPFHRRWPRFTCILIAAAIAPPMFQSIRMILQTRRSYTPDEAVRWVESNIPAGTALYTATRFLNPLPTPAAADRIWRSVTDIEASQQKFQAGLKRFNLNVEQIPRALSEENLVQDRGNMRNWFILGSQPTNPRPRYDIHPINASQLSLNTNTAIAAFKQTGGVIIIYTEPGESPPGELGTSIVSWHRPGTTGAFIYCSPDVQSKLP